MGYSGYILKGWLQKYYHLNVRTFFGKILNVHKIYIISQTKISHHVQSSNNGNSHCDNFKYYFHPFIMNASLMEIQVMVPTPFALNFTAFPMSLWRFFYEQVGMKSPGARTRIFFFLFGMMFDKEMYGDAAVIAIVGCQNCWRRRWLYTVDFKKGISTVRILNFTIFWKISQT